MTEANNKPKQKLADYSRCNVCRRSVRWLTNDLGKRYATDPGSKAPHKCRGKEQWRPLNDDGYIR